MVVIDLMETRLYGNQALVNVLYAFCSKWLTQIFVDCNRFSKVCTISLAAHLQDNSRPKSPTEVETKRKLQQFTVSGWLIIKGGSSDSEKRKL